jgi:DHA1 family bicyclomycin/chloramphenicol resistance-like MFS transporter
MIIPTIPVLAQQFGVSAGGAAQIVTAFALGKLVGTVIGGVVLDRMGTRRALVGGPLLASVASLSAAGAPWLIAILGLALIMGAADSLWATAREIAGIDLARRNQRGRVLSSLHGTYNIGATIAPLLGGWLRVCSASRQRLSALVLPPLWQFSWGLPDRIPRSHRRRKGIPVYLAGGGGR